MTPKEKVRIGISGTGYIARGLAALLQAQGDRYEITTFLTRRCLDTFAPPIHDAIVTDSRSTLIERSDLVVECSGWVGAAARVAHATTTAGVPLVTLNAEFQLALGAAFSGSNLIAEAQGDQPGSLAALDQEVRSMGFQPLVYGSQKGFLNRFPDAEDMDYWAAEQGISVSFTDGTKLNIEQALVANAHQAAVLPDGMLGPRSDSLVEGGAILAQHAKELGSPIADFILKPGGRGEVFIIATHSAPSDELAYYKLGNGPHYLVERPFHLGHFEVPITIERMLEGRPPLPSAGDEQRYSVAAVAKHDLASGTRIARATGSYEFYGVAVNARADRNHVPIGLLENCALRHAVAKGQTVQWGDVDLSDDFALALAKELYSDA